MDRFITSTAGVRVPSILYGTAWKKEATARLVESAIREGFRGIDTACQPKHYQESGVGAGIAAALSHPRASGNKISREGLYLQSKFTPLGGQDPARIPYDPEARLADQVKQSLAASLRNLQTDYLDGLILHSPLPSAAGTLEVWRAMESLVQERRVRQLGISNCALEELESLWDSARVKPAVIQNRFHADTHYDREIREFCRRRSIIYQSFWTLTANAHILTHPTVNDMASRYDRTAAQILFRYLTQTDVVPLTGTRSPTHMREDLAIFEFELTAADLEALNALL